MIKKLKGFLKKIVSKKKGDVQISNTDEAFDIIKSAFETGSITPEVFLKYKEKYELIKSTPDIGRRLTA